MSKEKFSMLTKFLHFIDNTDEEIVERDLKLNKILLISEYLKNKLQKVKYPIWKSVSMNLYCCGKVGFHGNSIFLRKLQEDKNVWNFCSGTKLGCEITNDKDLFSTKVVLKISSEYNRCCWNSKNHTLRYNNKYQKNIEERNHMRRTAWGLFTVPLGPWIVISGTPTSCIVKATPGNPPIFSQHG
ncbi:hypothetical protein J437_LFUL005952 [Ladona fulva]|uniref:Uncharacterized protein n=1 Tax=Ladona fulva TaxID=123851 RepID=A0A8K0K081_LADFU|nr:hypothetical protein J437_LFUL005952 [Ladona fulva]